ncbi:tyrosine-type recombinase/integrase [Treponema sp.]|uniref:tyrosine-type recombinase/integrase n=1 Tax=Treponema sp. TaxID=166 RepID=UPI00298EBADD|nr:tyrosine-type recombinase/integrase [Treponema sp.]
MGERITVSDAVDEFLVYLKTIKGFSQNTVISYKNDLEKFKFFCGKSKFIDELEFNDLRYAIPCLSERGEKSTSINRYIAAVRSLFAYCRKFDYIKENPSLRLKTVRGDKPYHQVVTDNEMYKVCKSPEEKKLLWPARDKALFEMLYSSGCRVSEICSLTLKSFSPGFSKAKITGKGNKDRIVFFEADALDSLKVYLKEREECIKKNKVQKEPESLFINQAGTPLTQRGVAWILSKYTSVEGINHHFSPHDFRHAFATALVNEGLDIRKVQALLGHSSISTTQRYTHVSRAKVESDYRKAHPHGGKNE